jgi:hypothetical protein
MSHIEYRHRAYVDGDEVGINALYQKVTGRVRSAEQFRWQWLDSPGGRGEIWLIEAMHDNGDIELIGHHGLMPVRFTKGEKDLLFGKTENTMVLPEYRRKILYPRFEKLFAEQYESRFHALFSTMGPSAAIRQRKAHGYAAEHAWQSLEHGVFPFGSLARLFAYSGQWRSFAGLVKCLPIFSRPVCGVQCLSPQAAKSSSVFDDYWTQARSFWGVVPRRDKADLTWRYWDNPYIEYETLVFERPEGVVGYVIVDLSAGTLARLVDISFLRPEAELIECVMSSLFSVLRKTYGCVLFQYLVTDDVLPEPLFAQLRAYFRPSLLTRAYRAARVAEENLMPRKITALGKQCGLSASDWGITPIVLEGRA